MIKKPPKKVSLESLDRRVDNLDEKLNGLDTRLERIEESQRKTGVQLDRLEYKFDLCIEGFGSLRERTEKIEDRVSTLEENR